MKPHESLQIRLKYYLNQALPYDFNSCSSELVDAPFMAKPRSLLGRMAKVALCQVSPKATPGCITVSTATASTIIAPSRIIRATSSLANFESKPACSSATRKMDRTKMRMVAVARAEWQKQLLDNQTSMDIVPSQGDSLPTKKALNFRDWRTMACFESRENRWRYTLIAKSIHNMM